MTVCAASVSTKAVQERPVVEPAPLQSSAAGILVPAVVAARAVVENAVPVSREVTQSLAANPLSTALIIRWEIGSPQRYAAQYERPVWPGGASGVTWGIGYDGGQATRKSIAYDWSNHPQVDRLLVTAGIAGAQAHKLVSALQDVRTPYALAETVFSTHSLPTYRAEARRTFGQNFDRLDLGDRAALESLEYNRGPSMAGDRNREKRVIRDVCVPAVNSACIARELRSMKRLWPTVRGLRDRREDEARTAEGA